MPKNNTKFTVEQRFFWKAQVTGKQGRKYEDYVAICPDVGCELLKNKQNGRRAKGMPLNQFQVINASIKKNAMQITTKRQYKLKHTMSNATKQKKTNSACYIELKSVSIGCTMCIIRRVRWK